ncbi:MAG: mercury(II) reductase [Candidatus Promineifilaceae bacterium]
MGKNAERSSRPANRTTGTAGPELAAERQAAKGARLNPRPTRVRAASRAGDGRAFDLLVIGAGSAGFAAASRGAELGYRVAMAGAGTIGGTCVNVGCVPSKALIRALEAHHLAGQRRFRGVETRAGRLDWPAIIAHKDELVRELRQSKYVDVLAAYPAITYIEGRARLAGRNGAEIGGRTYLPGKIIVTSGAHAWAPPVPGLPESGFLTSTTALDLTELPKSMLVLGAGAVGLELAQTFARAGTAVTLLELLPRIAPSEDEDISQALAGYLEAEGLTIVTGFLAGRVGQENGRYRLRGRQNQRELAFEAEQLLVAAGRRPNTDGLGLVEAGVRLGPQGEILVDQTLQTSNPAVYAAGDVLGREMFVYAAANAGALAAENALENAGRLFDTSYIPRITFTDPQIASAGLTEAQARAQGFKVRAGVLAMEHVARAQVSRDTRGLIKMVVDEASDRLLGVHTLAPEGGEIIQTAALAIRFGITAQQLRETMFPYLTNAEGLKLAALSLERDVALLSCCAG